jgi:hypothetical protein
MQVGLDDGDKLFLQYSTQGYAARADTGDKFLASEYDSIMFLDADMVHPADALAKLKSHDKDIVVGHYYKRQTNPAMSCILGLNDTVDNWPYLPLTDPPRSGLHEVAAGGFGIVLIKRQVVIDVMKYLGDAQPFTNGTLTDLVGDMIQFGSDVRFFLAARHLGYKVWLDASVESLHGTLCWIGHEFYERNREDINLFDSLLPFVGEGLRRWGVSLQAFQHRMKLLEAYQKGLDKQLAPVRAKEVFAQINSLFEANPDILEAMQRQYILAGQIAEVEQWISWEKAYPKITLPEQLPTVGDKNIETARKERLGHPDVEDETSAEELRQNLYKKQAKEFTDELPPATGA